MHILTATFLRYTTPLISLGVVIAHSIALFSNKWLYSDELMSNKEYQRYNISSGPEFLSKLTISGLWRLCQNKPGNDEFNCSKIDYFTNEEYTPDLNDSTMVIPYASKRAAYFMIISTGLILIAFFFCILGNSYRRKKVLNFISGIIFILSGLLILGGIIIYISTFKGEVGHKLREKSSLQEPRFRFQYGISFMFAVASLMMCELAGIFSIFLYIRLHKQDIIKRMEMENRFLNIPNELPPPPLFFCRKHGEKGRRYSSNKDIIGDASSPIFYSKPHCFSLSNVYSSNHYHTYHERNNFERPDYSTTTSSADNNHLDIININKIRKYHDIKKLDKSLDQSSLGPNFRITLV